MRKTKIEQAFKRALLYANRDEGAQHEGDILQEFWDCEPLPDHYRITVMVEDMKSPTRAGQIDEIVNKLPVIYHGLARKIQDMAHGDGYANGYQARIRYEKRKNGGNEE